MQPTTPAQPAAPQPAIQQPASPPPQFSPLHDSPVKKWTFLIAKILGIVLLLVLIIGITAASITVYTKVKLPIISDHRKDLTLLFYKIPLIPKNPEQILITAVDKNTRLKTYTPDFSLTAQLKSTDVELGSIDLQINGPVDITDEKNIAFSVDGKAALNFGGHSYEIDGKLIEKDKAIYAKIDKLPAEIMNFYGTGYNGVVASQTPQQEIQQNFEELFKNWIKYEFKNLPTEARAELEKNIQDTSITNKIREEAQNFLLKSSILPEVKKLADAKIDGVDCYHLLLNPSQDKIKQIILDYIDEHPTLQKKEYQKATNAIAGSFEQLHLEVWVGKSDAIVRKTSMQTQMDLGFIPSLLYPASATTQSNPLESLGLGDLGKAKLAFSTVVILSDVNKPVTITLPDKTVTIEEYSKLFQDAFLTKAARLEKEKQQQESSDMTELNTALTKFYVDNARFPGALTELQGKYIASSSPLNSRLSTYSYRRGINTSKFVVYVLVIGKYDSSYSTPYFGFTNAYSYPHQLMTREFTDLNQ